MGGFLHWTCSEQIWDHRVLPAVLRRLEGPTRASAADHWVRPGVRPTCESFADEIRRVFDTACTFVVREGGVFAQRAGAAGPWSHRAGGRDDSFGSSLGFDPRDERVESVVAVGRGASAAVVHAGHSEETDEFRSLAPIQFVHFTQPDDGVVDREDGVAYAVRDEELAAVFSESGKVGGTGLH